MFHWVKEQQAAFVELKHLITKVETLSYFKVSCRMRIFADAYAFGLGAVLTQQQGGMWRVVLYMSRSLTEVECCYSQMEKEALGLIWACDMYVSRQSFELETDDKLLELIYPHTSKSCVQLERLGLKATRVLF